MDNKVIKSRFEELVSDRKVAEEVWDLIEIFILPLRGGKFFQPLSSEGEIDWKRREIYDDTAMLGADTLAASIHGSLTSAATKWFDHRFRTKVLNKDNEAKKWLEECSNQVWWTIQESNFNLEISESYLDLVGFGNTMFAQEVTNELTWEGITFDSVPLRESYFEEDNRGQVKCFYRLLQWKPSKIISKFGDKVPDSVKVRAEKAVSEKIDIIFCIYPIKENADADTSKVIPISGRPYGYKYILRESGEMLGEVGGYYEMPSYAIRWRRTAGSQWGYGPGHLAIPTILTLNELVKLVLMAAEKAVDPTNLTTLRGLLSDLDLSPGGLTVVKDIDGSLKPYESGARFDVSALQIKDLRDLVRRQFHVDQLELKESPAMSATEVMVRYELMNRLLGPTMGRLQNDLLDPVVNNTFIQLFRAGELPEMPQSVADAGGVVDIEYVGPLSRAQKMDEVAAVERWLGILMGVSEVFPEIRDVPNPIEIAKVMAQGLNIPADLMHTDTEVTTIQQLRKQLEGAMQQLEMMQQQGEAAKAQGEGAQAMQGAMNA